MCYPMVIARFLMTNAINQLLRYQNQNASTHLIIDYLDLIKKIIQLLRYSNLFDFDQLLISIQIGSIEKSCVSEALKADITYLLPLCEHGDLHLRGAPANLLIICLNDNNTRVIHVSLNALRTLLPFLLINSHAFTIIEIKLLKDSIQHTTSSCTLAKFALAQLIDNIDFRILTYLEQQQQLKQHYPDIRVRQAIASTFAKFVDHNSFLLCQWIYKIHHSLQAQASTRIQIVCHNEKDSSTTSNTDKDKKVNRTQLGTFGNYSN
ncbi:unnamed protein product [Rotaria sp. Silwood1]|nr:unnamed protein product [Rotaria sp. Silwood1]